MRIRTWLNSPDAQRLQLGQTCPLGTGYGITDFGNGSVQPLNDQIDVRRLGCVRGGYDEKIVTDSIDRAGGWVDRKAIGQRSLFHELMYTNDDNFRQIYR